MIKKIMYIVSLLSISILFVLTLDMLPYIFKTGFEGICFLLLVTLLLIIELYMLLRYKNLLKEGISYNLFIVLIVLYATIVYYKIYSKEIYSIDLSSLRKNYALLNTSFIIIFFDLWSIISETKKKNKV